MNVLNPRRRVRVFEPVPVRAPDGSPLDLAPGCYEVDDAGPVSRFFDDLQPQAPVGEADSAQLSGWLGWRRVSFLSWR